jgi:adhesin transport system membrane fusion protein
MLNISLNSVSKSIDKKSFKSLNVFQPKKRKRKKRILFTVLIVLIILILFLPWTQNIQAKGYVTSLQPEQRPQSIVSLISGRIDKWYVQEGDFVKKGDTIIFISEIKDEYFDPNLLQRTQEQITAKESSVNSYMEKVKALDSQVDALNKNLQLKLEQNRNKLKQAGLKVTADSIDLYAARINERIADQQYERFVKLYEEGLKSKTDLENRNLKLQETKAKTISLESKLLSARNDVINARVQLNSTRADFQNKISKAESDKFSTLSSMYDAEASVTKLQNQYSNYNIRTGYYYIRAPQDGYITKAILNGIGETIKEGERILTIMPATYQLAIEMYVKPLDLPLLNKGQEIRIQFDGWPAIIFSGWPGVSTGTFGGSVVAIDNFTSDNGLYRVLVAPDKDAAPWPSGLRVGAGARSFALLNDVPVYYELWRQINGFPPDYYTLGNKQKKQAEEDAKK